MMSALTATLLRRAAERATMWSERWSRFWFEEQSRSRVELFRTLFAALMFGFYFIRFFDLELLYSEHGIFPTDILDEVYHLKERYSLLYWIKSDFFLWTAQTISLVCYALLFFGKIPRLAAFVVLILHISFVYRNLGVVYGVDLISTFYLLYLIGMDHGKSTTASPWLKDVQSVAFRFAQLEVCIIYLYSGLHKMKGSGWWSGDAVWQVIANQQLARMDFSAAAHFPTLMIVSTYVTLFWEVYFPVLVWPKQTRKIMLWVGFLIHLGIAVSASLVVFGLLMTLLYALFLEEAEADRIMRRIKSLDLKAIVSLGRLREF